MGPDWATIVADFDARFPTEQAALEELARLQGGDNAFPEDALRRGRQIFMTVGTGAKRLCDDPRVRRLIQDSGPRTSEVMTIVPLLLNLLPANALSDASVALVALLIVRMGVGRFCATHAATRP